MRKNFVSISKKPIKPNKYLHYSPVDTDIDEYYILYGLILHHNAEINEGHFEVLLFIDNLFYQCNDSHISEHLKSDISNSTLQKKSYIFYYKKIQLYTRRL